MLQNKEGLWTSNDKWNFRTKGDLFYIKNLKERKFLGLKDDGEVIFGALEEGKAHQLWKKGNPNSEGFFTLENSKVPKFLTVVVSNSSKHHSIMDLKIIGNITIQKKS